jgi:hypothetical protein
MNPQRELTLQELKAAAYDALANKEYWQTRLQQLNQLIERKANEAGTAQGLETNKKIVEKEDKKK